MRLEENLTFFVPASYLREIPNKPAGSTATKPPPRPPPPPPSALLERLSSLDNSDPAETANKAKPEIKKRRVQQQQQQQQQHNRDSEERRVYQNDGDETEDEDDPSNIISDLDERLNIEDKSSFANEAPDQPNRTPVVLSTFSGRRARSSTTTNTTSTANCNNSQTGDYEADQHIYQNLPLNAANSEQQTVSVKRTSLNFLPAESSNTTHAKCSSRATRVIMSDASNNENKSSARNSNGQGSATRTSGQHGMSTAAVAGGASRGNTNKEEEANNSDSENVPVPRGWHIEPNKYDRKCYVNELTGERWYLNYDSAGKHYFYNANNEAVWELPAVFHNQVKFNLNKMIFKFD